MAETPTPPDPDDRPPLRLVSPAKARHAANDQRSLAEDAATGQRDRLYDLLSAGQTEQARLLGSLNDKLDTMSSNVASKLDVVNGSVGSLQAEITALRVTPMLIGLLAVGMVLGLLALGVLLKRQVDVDLDTQGLHATTGMTATTPTAHPVTP